MPSIRSRIVRLLVRHVVSPKFKKAGDSITEWRKLNAMVIRNQRVPKGTDVEPVQVDAVRGLCAEWVRAPNALADRAVLYLHGGGFIMGSPATHREIAARLSALTNACTLVLDYRLAPEHPFPASLHDSVAAYRWLQAIGLEPERIAIGGDSAGGTLTLQTLIAERDTGNPMPAAAFLMSPVTDWVHFDGNSYRTRAAVDPCVTLETNRMMAAYYVGNNHPQTPLLCPGTMDLTGIPPLVIHVGDHEVLLSDSTRLAERARSSGVEVELVVWPGMWHGFQVGPAYFPEVHQSIEQISRFVSSHTE